VRRVPLALSAATLAVLTLTAVSCGDDTAGIALGEVAVADVVEVVDAPAAVAATAAATLTAAAEGAVAELAVGPGDEVAEGDILAVIESPEAERRLEQAEAALAAAESAASGGGFGGADLSGVQRATDAAAAAAFDHARAAAGHLADEDLADALRAQVNAAQKQYEAAAAAAAEAVRSVQYGVASLGSAVTAMATAQRLQAQQAYDLASATVDALTLRAPFDGVVQLGGATGDAGSGGLGDLLGIVAGEGGELAGEAPAPGGSAPAGVDTAVTAGARVSAGTPVLTIVDVAELTLIAEVDETDVLLVEPGIEAEVELDAALGATYPATVTAVDLLPTPSARGGVSYRVRMALGEGTWPDGGAAPRPRPGMSAVAHLNVREAAQTLAVPAAALVSVDGTDMVWVVRGGRATRTPVTVGVQGPDLVEVTAGLAAGDRIVISGTDLVEAGMRLP